MIMTTIELNTDILQTWKQRGFGYVITEELDECEVDPETAEFMVYPQITAAEAEEFVLHKIRGVPFELQHKINCFDINSDSAREIAQGIFSCKFYVADDPSKTYDSQPPHKVSTSY